MLLPVQMMLPTSHITSATSVDNIFLNHYFFRGFIYYAIMGRGGGRRADSAHGGRGEKLKTEQRVRRTKSINGIATHISKGLLNVNHFTLTGRRKLPNRVKRISCKYIFPRNFYGFRVKQRGRRTPNTSCQLFKNTNFLLAE